MILIHDVVPQAPTTSYLNVEAKEQLRRQLMGQVRLGRVQRFHDLAASGQAALRQFVIRNS